MKSYDVIFIHPPRVLKRDYGKNAKIARGSYIFIPMGLFAITDYLERNGFSVNMINYPLEQYLNRNWDLSDHLRSISFKVCAIDLHWIHNAHGAIEVAKIVKSVNPNAKVILGGYSASYFHDQILKYYKVIDGIIRGDGEIPLLNYVERILKGQSLDSVPNLSYRDTSNHLKINSLTYVAKNIDEFNFTNTSILHNAKSYFEDSRKIMGISFNLPIGRGCPFNCPFCAGGQRTQQNISGRECVILRSPEKVVEDISIIVAKYKVSSVFFGHGAYPASLKYWKELFELIQKENFDIGGDLEIWRLPFPKEMWSQYHRTFTRKHSSLSISPRTMSTTVQNKIARICDPTFKFPPSQINDLIKNSNLFRMSLRIWLTTGYPFQSRLDLLRDFDFVMKCMLKNGTSKSKPIAVMSEPYHIFPGSPAYESPELFNIKIKYGSFPELVEAFKRIKMSFFFNAVNYDTKYFSSSTILNTSKLFFILSAPMFLTA